jgi:hypothetical protein
VANFVDEDLNHNFSGSDGDDVGQDFEFAGDMDRFLVLEKI